MATLSLGQFIRQMRNKANLSMSEMARRLQITPPFVSDIEMGRRNPSDEVLQKMASLFGIAVEEFKKYDPRVTLSDLKRLMEQDPNLGLAFRTVIDSVDQGKTSTSDVAKRVLGESK